MLLKLISCNVFIREACLAIAHSPHIVDPDFFELGLHLQPDELRKTLQQRIDATEQSAKQYDAILLFNDGLLTPQANDARWMARVAEIDQAIVGESARWGDQHNEPPLDKYTPILTTATPGFVLPPEASAVPFGPPRRERMRR